MPNRIHAKLQGMEATGRNAVLDRVLPKPVRPQLAVRHDSVLAPGELRNLKIQSGLASGLAPRPS
jgi:hypothetical protein